jgi:hypothetical protein
MFKSIDQAKRVLNRLDPTMFICHEDDQELNLLEYAFNKILYFDDKSQLDYINEYVLRDVHDYYIDKAKTKYFSEIHSRIKDLIKEVLKKKPFKTTLKKKFDDKVRVRKARIDNITKRDLYNMRIETLQEFNYLLNSDINNMIIEHYNHFS